MTAKLITVASSHNDRISNPSTEVPTGLPILNDPILINELQAFTATRSPSGFLRYSAPEGLHDDCVMALALAWSAAVGYPGLVVSDPRGGVIVADVIRADRERGEPRRRPGDDVPFGHPRAEWEEPWSPGWRPGKGIGF